MDAFTRFMSVTERLGQRAMDLEQQGAHPLRVELLHRARRFKRSWIDMAEGLAELRANRAYEDWGYDDLHAYCAGELLLQKRTVEKLTGSFRTIERHAPQMLDPERSDEPMPTIDAVDYFARAMGEHREGAAKPAEDNGVVEELRKAVFDDPQPLSVLRKQFNDVLYPKSPAEDALAVMQRANSAANRLCNLLPDIDGLQRARISEVAAALDALIRDIEVLLPKARERATLDKAS
jgi:hypothetical protein